MVVLARTAHVFAIYSLMATRPSTASRAREAAKFAADILDDLEYRRNLKARAMAGMLPSGMEQMLWYYRYGKPAERIEINDLGKVDLTEMSPEELTSRIQAIQHGLLELAKAEAKIEAQRARDAAAAAMDDPSMLRDEAPPFDEPVH